LPRTCDRCERQTSRASVRAHCEARSTGPRVSASRRDGRRSGLGSVPSITVRRT
jgi:hypothetical protein